MSPVIEPTRLSTVLFAWLRAHGADDEQAVPVPLGDTYSVVCTAALASPAPSAPIDTADEASPSMDSQTSGARGRIRIVIGVCLFVVGNGNIRDVSDRRLTTVPACVNHILVL